MVHVFGRVQDVCKMCLAVPMMHVRCVDYMQDVCYLRARAVCVVWLAGCGMVFKLSSLAFFLDTLCDGSVAVDVRKLTLSARANRVDRRGALGKKNARRSRMQRGGLTRGARRAAMVGDGGATCYFCPRRPSWLLVKKKKRSQPAVSPRSGRWARGRSDLPVDASATTRTPL